MQRKEYTGRERKGAKSAYALRDVVFGASGQASRKFGGKKADWRRWRQSDASRAERQGLMGKKGLQPGMQRAKYRGWVGHARDELTDGDGVSCFTGTACARPPA